MLIKTKKEIKLIKEGGKLMGRILSDLKSATKPGMSTWEVDKLAEKMIIKAGGRPAFKGYQTRAADPPFPSTICASVNTELVHGMARKDVILKSGDIFSIDIGMEWPYNPPKKNTDKARLFGYFTDTAITFAVGEVSEEIKKLLAVTKQALEVGIAAAKPGKSVASIGKAIEKYVDSEGDFGIVRDLVGHGVGHLLHEDPAVPNYYDPGLEEVILQPGMVIAIEPMISLGKNYHIKTKKDGWTIEMSDGSLCAHFEHSLVITREGNTVVTRRPQEQKEKLW